MANSTDDGYRATERIRLVARSWSLVIMAITLLVVVAQIVTPDPNATDYPPSENLLPLAMCLSVVGWALPGVGRDGEGQST